MIKIQKVDENMKLLEKLRTKNGKIVLGCCALVIIVACGGVVYAVNKIDGNNEILCEVEEDEVDEEVAKPEEVETLSETTQPPIIEEVKPEETANKEEPSVINENQKENVEVNENQSEPVKQKEEPKKQPANSTSQQSKPEPKQTNNNPISYTSSGLGITFDMPASWRDKYYIEDTGSIVKIYTKHSQNNIGCGLLITITSDGESCGNGEYLDTIGGEKAKNINGKTYYVGGPLDFRMEEDDSLVEVYRNMIQQRESVVKSLR